MQEAIQIDSLELMQKVRCFCFFVYIICYSATITKAQTFTSDLHLIADKSAAPVTAQKRQITFLFIPDKKIIKYNPISLALGGMMYLYQSVISSQIAADCPYEVSCSSFSKQMITRYGAFKGIALSADRITRCSYLSSIDIHPLDYTATGKIIDSPAEYKIKHEE